MSEPMQLFLIFCWLLWLGVSFFMPLLLVCLDLCTYGKFPVDDTKLGLFFKKKSTLIVSVFQLKGAVIGISIDH